MMRHEALVDGEWRALTPDESIRLQAAHPLASRESIIASVRPWIERADPAEARRLLALINDCLAERDGPAPSEPVAPVEASADGPSAEDVAAERARRMGAGEAAGYRQLARHFHVSETTIRRRLGKSV